MSTLFPLSSWARRWALAAGCLLGFGATASAQAPANDNCSGAITLTPGATCVPTTGTTVNATTSLPGGPTGNPTNAVVCNGLAGNADDDVWYKFVATATSHAITATPTGPATGGGLLDLVLDIRSGGPSGGTCPGTNIACSDEDPSVTTTEYVVATGLTTGNTYYVRIYSLGSGAATTGPFSVCVSAAPNCAGPTGLLVSNIAGNTATVSFAASTPSSSVTGYTVTYTATSPAAGTPVTVTVTGSPVNLTGLTLGTTYNVTVIGNCTSGGSSNPVSTTFATTGVSNDDCTVAINLTPGVSCVPTSGTTVGATQSIAPIQCGSGTAGAAKDVWYKFTAFGTAATIIVAGGTIDPIIDVRNTCPVTSTTPSIACQNSNIGVGTSETLNLTGLSPSTVYYIRVYANSATATGTFTICITGVPCLAPTALAATNTTATGTTLTFTPPAANAVSYTVTYSTPGQAAQTQTSTTAPITITGLTPSTTYTVSLVTNCSATNSSAPVTTTFTTFAACPAPTGIAATNLTSTSATITFTPPASGPVSYTVTYTAAGSTTPQTQTGTGSPITLNGLTPGTGYTVTLVGNCSTTGTAATSAPLTANFITPNICAPVTGLSATTISANSATLTFTSAPTGTTYTVLYSTPGQATQLLTVSTSPATLTGLLAGKVYNINVVSTCGSSQTSTVATTTLNTVAAAPTGASAIQIQSTSANVTFTAPAGAVAYTITYTTAAGVSSTTTGTAPPMALTNLSPNTTYTVTIVATYPGGGQSAPITFTFTTGVLATRSALAGGKLAVFPNPAHANFTVSLPALGAARTAELELVNTLGQRVRQQTLALTPGGTQAAIDASSLPAGIYLLRVQAGGETAVTRVVLE